MKILTLILCYIFFSSIGAFSKEPQKIAEDLKKSTVIISGFFEELDWGSNDKEDWIGTGIIIDKKGKDYIVATNAHVVGFWAMYEADAFSPGDSILRYNLDVRFADDANKYIVKNVFISRKHKDLALVVFESDQIYPKLNMNSENVKVGETVYAMGHPKGLEFTFTSGIISAIRKYNAKSSENYKFLQTQAAINSGNSGGPLVDVNGNFVGINTMKISQEGVEGLGFAISVNELMDLIETKDYIEMPTDHRLISQWLRAEFNKFKKK